MQYSVHSFRSQYLLILVWSPSSCLHLHPCLPIPSVFPSAFPSIMCFRRQLLLEMWSVQLAFFHYIYIYIYIECSVWGWCSLYSNSLRAVWSVDRITVGGQDFLHSYRPALGTPQPPVQWVSGSFLGVKWLGHGVDHPLPSNAEMKERVELYIYSFSGPSCPVLGWTLKQQHIPSHFDY
jgi:hypothetical protein